MSLRRLLLGRVLSDSEAESERIGVAAGVPILGLDALASAAYGPEAALTILLPLGASGLHLATPIAAVIIVLLVVVQASYRHTIQAYPRAGPGVRRPLRPLARGGDRPGAPRGRPRPAARAAPHAVPAGRRPAPHLRPRARRGEPRSGSSP